MTMSRFEDAMLWIVNRHGAFARRKVWADMPDYTRSTPPLAVRRRWIIWQDGDNGTIINGWGGVVGGDLEDGDPIRDGTAYRPTDEDRVAQDWELCERG